MARPKQVIPSYQRHKATGQARTYIDGQDFYLGPYGSEQSRRRYGELIARHTSGLPPVDPMAKPKAGAAGDDPGPSVADIILAFTFHAESHYVKNGKPTSEVDCFRSCLRIVRELFGTIPAKDFGPLAMKAVRAAMVAGDPDAKDASGKPTPRKPWARTTVNRQVGRIRQAFKHAIENEMIDAGGLERLKCVSALRAGHTKARDNAPRHAVDQENIEAVRQRVGPLVKDLIDLQLRTGARSGELLMLTTGMIDRSDEVWKVGLADHKCFHHGLKRTLHFGPQAKLILMKYLSADQDKPLFAITRTAYCRAITRACKRAKIDRWTPHWLRHTYSTRTREERGIEAVQAVVGHSTSDMTERYSRQMDKLARATAEAVG